MMSSSVDSTVMQAGTPRYMAPEFVKNSPYTSKIDVWALGVILYEMCSGTAPFDSEGILDLYFQITQQEPNALSPKYSE